MLSGDADNGKTSPKRGSAVYRAIAKTDQKRRLWRRLAYDELRRRLGNPPPHDLIDAPQDGSTLKKRGAAKRLRSMETNEK